MLSPTPAWPELDVVVMPMSGSLSWYSWEIMRSSSLELGLAVFTLSIRKSSTLGSTSGFGGTLELSSKGIGFLARREFCQKNRKIENTEMH